ncbi:hypothetical protein O9992_28830 [Vibrio lentus]|nr:hypothetical protein [Vibrio lentus]
MSSILSKHFVVYENVPATHFCAFIPNYAPYVEQGFNALQNILTLIGFVVGAVVVDTLGMRAMV